MATGQCKRQRLLNLFNHSMCRRCFNCLNFKDSFGIDIMSIPVNIAMEWMPSNLVDGGPALVRVMACCHQTKVDNYCPVNLSVSYIKMLCLCVREKRQKCK